MTDSKLPKAVAVIGAGTMGNGIAQVFATSGVETYLIDVSEPFLQRGTAAIHKSLGKFVEKGKLTADQAEATKSRLHASTEMGPLGDVELCIEADPVQVGRHDDEGVGAQVFLAVAEIKAFRGDEAWFFGNENGEPVDDGEGEVIEGVILVEAVGFHGESS